MNVGFIGLGHMGQPMALSLLKSGQRLVVYNRTHSKAEPLAAQGADMANNIAEACRTDVVITMLPTTRQSRKSCSVAVAFYPPFQTMESTFR
jgi:3-hydroxyisobutyrate dehydrogenase-like beta-hydroxyacid dehydrogenase